MFDVRKRLEHFQQTLANFMSYVFKFTAPLSEGARSHLVHVYSLLTMGVITAAVGCFVDMNFLRMGGLLTGFAGAVLFGFARSGIVENELGSALFLVAAGLEGAALSPLIHTALLYYPHALVTALLSSLAAFVSFSIAALIVKRREMLFIAGIISSIASYLALASLANMLINSSHLMDVQLYAGLAMFLGYILVDTQIMIERYESGNRNNFVRPACDLFADLVGVFVRLLIIIMKKSEKRRNSFSVPLSPERKYYKRQSE
jgi:FtsH-binding integral membrane protein